ncbi:hypothetical protein CW304_27730 [Bacillus sp. UFRGS-B20]|nr:hypothetical protein CW304_27730 [Bacillus sp. UFRGS-B20]
MELSAVIVRSSYEFHENNMSYGERLLALLTWRAMRNFVSGRSVLSSAPLPPPFFTCGSAILIDHFILVY